MVKALGFLFLVGGSSFAEVKPKGTILAVACGDLSRSEKVCFERVQDEDKKDVAYISVDHFRDGKDYFRGKYHSRLVFLESTSQQLETITITSYKVLAADENRRYPTETEEYKLVVTIKDEALSGTLYKNGKVSGSFPMEYMVHTESVN